MIAIALAVVLALAAFPLLLVFGPAHFPWTLLVLASLGGIVGLFVASSDPRSRALKAVVLALLMVVVVLAVITLTSNLVVSPTMISAALRWTAWVLLPLLVGALAGAWLRAQFGVARGALVGAAAALAIALAGTGLAFAVAPPEVAGAPTCDRGIECPRTLCRFQTERQRLFAIERVTAFSDEHIVCTYTAWGGIDIGRAEWGRGGGSWTDGAWPNILTGR